MESITNTNNSSTVVTTNLTGNNDNTNGCKF